MRESTWIDPSASSERVIVRHKMATRAPNEDWDSDNDSVLEMDQLITAIAREWNGGNANSSMSSHSNGPCRCCGVILSDLDFLEKPPSSRPTPAEAVPKACSFLKAVIWNAQIVRRAVPVREEIVAALAALDRLDKLLNGDHEKVGRAKKWDRDNEVNASDERFNEWLLEGWTPPTAFLSDFTDFEEPVSKTIRAGRVFVSRASTIVALIDEFITSRMYDPPPTSGRPPVAFAERYVYRYLDHVGLKPAEIEAAVGPLVRKLRTAEEKIGLKTSGKSSNPASLRSTIRRCSRA